jgi:hypothetical protein
MATLSGTFTAPGVSGALTAATTVAIALSGISHRCDITLEQSLDSGATWATFDTGLFGVAVLRPNRSQFITGAVNEASYADPVGKTFTVPAGSYRINCTRFDSGFCSYTLTAT